MSGIEGVAVRRYSMFPNTFVRWYPAEGDEEVDPSTHVAYENLVAAALVAVAEAARKTLTCRQGVPAEVQQAQVDLMDAWKILADALAEAQAGSK